MAVSTKTRISPWTRHARQWSHVGSPLRPGEEDCQLFWSLIAGFVESLAEPRVLLLGVTPELALLPWPSRSHLTAAEQSQDMIDRVWPADELPCAGQAVCKKWQENSLPDASVDVILGDGSLSMVPSARQYPALFSEMHRILKAGGRFVLRCFVHPDADESVDQVFADLDAGEIGSMHALKWRIAMALQRTAVDGVVVSDIRDCFDAHVADRAAAARRLGWPIEAINTIDAYMGSSVVYTFPTLSEISEAVVGRFEIASVAYPSYELGERCPVIGFSRTG